MDNRMDTVEVYTRPTRGARTAHRFLEDKEVQQSVRYVGTDLAPNSGICEVKNSTKTHVHKHVVVLE